MRALLVICGLILSGCSGAPPEPASEPQPASGGTLSGTLEENGITVVFPGSVSENPARLVLAEALRARGAVEGYLGASIGEVEVRISEEHGIPFARGGSIYLPAGRMDQIDEDWAYDPMSITHEMTHLVGRGNRPDRMLAEGLAVHVNDLVGRPTYPNDGEDLHMATARLERELAIRIPLIASEGYRTSGSREERRLAYTQEGSFARYYIDRYGLESFAQLLFDDAAYSDEPELWARLEAEWRASLPPGGFVR